MLQYNKSKENLKVDDVCMNIPPANKTTPTKMKQTVGSETRENERDLAWEGTQFKRTIHAHLFWKIIKCVEEKAVTTKFHQFVKHHYNMTRVTSKLGTQ